MWGATRHRIGLAVEDFRRDRVLLAAGLLALVSVGLFIYRLFTLWLHIPLWTR
jgi:hypothetical protein